MLWVSHWALCSPFHPGNHCFLSPKLLPFLCHPLTSEPKCPLYTLLLCFTVSSVPCCLLFGLDCPLPVTCFWVNFTKHRRVGRSILYSSAPFVPPSCSLFPGRLGCCCICLASASLSEKPALFISFPFPVLLCFVTLVLSVSGHIRAKGIRTEFSVMMNP